ncbi:unnamed protein product [Mesocestoides corti]|uniref:Secreted protein n=1 Tax=Mesocestoides corti TaxID=53468 RepID=A0A0R3U6J7_MESCO|nr:unnamed protein product [Mesocestoides corti]
MHGINWPSKALAHLWTVAFPSSTQPLTDSIAPFASGHLTNRRAMAIAQSSSLLRLIPGQFCRVLLYLHCNTGTSVKRDHRNLLEIGNLKNLPSFCSTVSGAPVTVVPNPSSAEKSRVCLIGLAPSECLAL